MVAQRSWQTREAERSLTLVDDYLKIAGDSYRKQQAMQLNQKKRPS